MRSNMQFIMITHQRLTMETADVLYGVSMQADGVTKVISQKLGEAISAAAKEGNQ
jgi:chromosome segregation protein